MKAGNVATEKEKLMKEIDFKKICDHLIDAIYVTDGKGNTIYVNDAYLKLGDLKREDVMGINVFNICLLYTSTSS